MKSLLLASVVALSFGAIAQDKPAPTTYKVDTAATKVQWEGKKVAGPHNGDLKVKSGTLTVLGEEITTGNIVVDMTSINVKDLEGEWKGKLEGHLKAPDFFDTAKFPEATLAIKNSKKTAKGLEINGDLTIKGVTKPISFVATDVKKTADMFSAKGTMTVNRINYGVTYNAGKGDKSLISSLGDKMIYDDFTLTIDLQAKK